MGLATPGPGGGRGVSAGRTTDDPPWLRCTADALGAGFSACQKSLVVLWEQPEEKFYMENKFFSEPQTPTSLQLISPQM